jgi:integrase/recombinase XerD
MEIEEKPQEPNRELALIPVMTSQDWLTILEPIRRSIAVSGSDGGTTSLSFVDAFLGWLTKPASAETRKAYARDLKEFLCFVDIKPEELFRLLSVRSFDVAAWRDELQNRGLVPASIGRKITVLRSLYAHLQIQGVVQTNPAHPLRVATPPVSRAGKTVGLSPEQCRSMLDAPTGLFKLRDRAILAMLAYTGCRVGELCRMRVGDVKMTSGHMVVEIRGKGGKERRVPLHREIVMRIDAWLDQAELGAKHAHGREHVRIRDEPGCALFPRASSARGRCKDGFRCTSLSPRSVQVMVRGYARALGLPRKVTVHSFRVTALTTARERGCDLVEIQDFAGHSNPNTTLTYIRNRDRLDKSPAYAIDYG